MDDKRIRELEAQLAEAQAGWAAAEDRITIEAECCNQLRHDLANAQVAAEGARLAMEEVKRLQGERDRYKAALEKIAKERIPHPTPCRETYLRSIAKGALAEAVQS